MIAYQPEKYHVRGIPTEEVVNIVAPNMNLIEETIRILENTLIAGVSLLDLAFHSHDPEYDTWSGESLKNIEAALSKAAKSLSKQQLIDEYNELGRPI